MKIKANFHFHTGDDILDVISYTTFEGVDYAAEKGFGAIAITCHNTFAWTKEYFEYAKKRGVLLIPGVEVNVGETEKEGGRHVLVLNASPEAAEAHTFEKLAEYRRNHPESFIIAPHPYYAASFSLRGYLKKYVHLFDAVEHSWFYSKFFNPNRKARAFAKSHALPFISTSDTHFFDFLDTDYAVIEADEKTPEAIFRAIREGCFENATRPKRFFKEMFLSLALFLLRRSRINRERKDLRNRESRAIVSN